MNRELRFQSRLRKLRSGGKGHIHLRRYVRVRPSCRYSFSYRYEVMCQNLNWIAAGVRRPFEYINFTPVFKQMA